MAATSRGIDVSDYQGAQDWKALVRSGVTFAMVKATEGTHTRFDHYAMHMSGMLAAGVLPGAYHYAWPNQDAKAEADNYIATVRADADAHPGFTHWLDQERRTDGANYAGVNDAQIRAYATAWVARVKAAFPHQRVGVYTSGSDITAAHYPANSDALWYPAYPAGAMTYTQAEQRTRPAPGGIKCLFWQFTSTPLDRSICYMTPAALRTWAGATPTVREDAMPAPADLWGYRNADAVKKDPRLPDAYGYLVQTNAAVKTLTAAVTAQGKALQALADAQAKGTSGAQVAAAINRLADSIAQRLDEDDTAAAAEAVSAAPVKS